MNGSSVSDRTVIVTGATSGLGRVTAGELAQMPGWTVVVAARDAERGARVADELSGMRDGARAVALALDLADLESVRALPAALKAARLPPLGAIVANAGIQYRDRRHATADGFEATFGTNHLGHFLLLRLVLPQLEPDGRIAIVASGTHKPQRLRNGGFPPPAWREPHLLAQPGEGSGRVAYANSKLANVLTMLELSRRMEQLRPGVRIAVHGFDPGLMPLTSLSRDYQPRMRAAYERIAPLLVRLIPDVTTPEASGAQLARMVTDPGFASPSGRYIEIDRDGTPSATARDRALAAELWNASERLVGIA